MKIGQTIFNGAKKMKTKAINLTKEQTDIYDHGCRAWDDLRRDIIVMMDAIGEQNWRDGVHVEVLTCDGVLVMAHDYPGE